MLYHYFSFVTYKSISICIHVSFIAINFFYACFKDLYQDYIDKYVISIQENLIWWVRITSSISINKKSELKLGLIFFGTKIEYNFMFLFFFIKINNIILIFGVKKTKI
jgi:hypothetical protein